MQNFPVHIAQDVVTPIRNQNYVKLQIFFQDTTFEMF